MVLRGMDTRLFVLVFCHLYNNRISRYTTSRGGRTEQHVHYSCCWCTVRHDDRRHNTKHVSCYWRRRWWRTPVTPPPPLQYLSPEWPSSSRSCKYIYPATICIFWLGGYKIAMQLRWSVLCHQLDSLWDTTITAMPLYTGYPLVNVLGR